MVGLITDIIMPDKNGTEENIVYGFDNIEDYENKSPKFGCISRKRPQEESHMVNSH